MTNEEFEQFVREGIDAIDEKFLLELKNVEIIIEDNPTPYQMEKLKTSRRITFWFV